VQRTCISLFFCSTNRNVAYLFRASLFCSWKNNNNKLRKRISAKLNILTRYKNRLTLSVLNCCPLRCSKDHFLFEKPVDFMHPFVFLDQGGGYEIQETTAKCGYYFIILHLQSVKFHPSSAVIFLRCYGDVFVSKEFNEIHMSFLGHVSTR
jgi:hypothetical protein